MIKINRQKPFDIYYNVYKDGKRIRNGSKESLSNGETIELIESNVWYSKFWYFDVLFNLIIGLLSCSFDDYKDSKVTQRRLKIKIVEVNSGEFIINIPRDINKLTIDGVTLLEQLSYEEVRDEKIVKRLNIAKKSLIFVPVLILCIIFIILAVVLTR